MKKLARTTQTLDAAGKTPGRLASAIAPLLIGKTRPGYTPHIDSGDMVEVVNAGKMVTTGKKMEQKTYHYHTTHPGGLKNTAMKQLFVENAGEVLRHAVSRMLPKNRLRDDRLKRLTVKN